MDTYFASAPRQTPEEFQRELKIISSNPIIDSLLTSVSGLLAVLDEHRQILAVNDSLLLLLGLDNAENILGLRPGEAIRCIHAHEEPAGCGTTRFCASCGAAIAIVASLAHDQPEERICAATVVKNDEQAEICFKVRAAPINIDGRRFLLLFLQDITSLQNWAALEHVFFHDISNILTTLVSATELLQDSHDDGELLAVVEESVHRLKKEVELQKVLTHSWEGAYQVVQQEIRLVKLLDELQQFMGNHPAARGKALVIAPPPPIETLVSDPTLLKRILTNMLTNAFEATPEGGEVRFWVEGRNDGISFKVWNSQEIPEHLRPRIFQKHFSTKGGQGRGLGTYSMKLFGEKFLLGKVDFESSREAGTTFHLALT